MITLQVGKKYGDKEGPVPEGTQVEILPGTILFTFFMNKPSQEESVDFQEGKAQIRLHFEEDVLFFLIKLGEIPWVDAPYSRFLSKHKVDMDLPPKGKGFSVTMVLVDASNQIIKEIRVITLSHIQSNQLIEHLKAQKSINDFDEAIQRIYKKYPLSEDMIRAGKIYS